MEVGPCKRQVVLLVPARQPASLCTDWSRSASCKLYNRSQHAHIEERAAVVASCWLALVCVGAVLRAGVGVHDPAPASMNSTTTHCRCMRFDLESCHAAGVLASEGRSCSVAGERVWTRSERGWILTQGWLHTLALQSWPWPRSSCAEQQTQCGLSAAGASKSQQEQFLFLLCYWHMKTSGGNAPALAGCRVHHLWLFENRQT